MIKILRERKKEKEIKKKRDMVATRLATEIAVPGSTQTYLGCGRNLLLMAKI